MSLTTSSAALPLHSPLPAKLAPSLCPAQAKFTPVLGTHALPSAWTDLPSPLRSNVSSSVGHSLTTHPCAQVTPLPQSWQPHFFSVLFLSRAPAATTGLAGVWCGSPPAREALRAGPLSALFTGAGKGCLLPSACSGHSIDGMSPPKNLKHVEQFCLFGVGPGLRLGGSDSFFAQPTSFPST